MEDGTVEQRRADSRPTVEFDHHSPDIAPDPYPAYAKLRARCPVAWSEAYGGFWVLSDYASVYAASQDDESFRSAPTIALPPQPYGIRNVPIDTDSPETEQFRRILLAAYSPAAVKRLEPEMVALADELIDAFIAEGRCDLVRDYAMPLPARMVLRLIGLDERDWLWYVDRIHTIIHGMTGDTDATIAGGMEIAGRLAEQINHRRETGDLSGQLGALLIAEVDGAPLSDIDVMSYVFLLLFGGLDTTTAALANAVVLLDRDRDTRRELIEHPERLGRAVEEFLRFEAPVQALGRTLSRDVELGGHRLRAGERALLIWASANRDPAVFPDPERFDAERTPNRHLAFGVGLHRCLGSNLGRAMFHVMLDRLLARIPDYRLTEDPTPHRYSDAAIVFALHHLPVAFTPEPERA
ncbi:MAG TPA: cytochrome P450 [Pseudonocardia sp.]